jgi:hypothetical protein
MTDTDSNIKIREHYGASGKREMQARDPDMWLDYQEEIGPRLAPENKNQTGRAIRLPRSGHRRAASMARSPLETRRTGLTSHPGCPWSD